MKIAIIPIASCVLLLVSGCQKPQSNDAGWSRFNLREIGLAFRMWADDHDGQFPFNVSQAQGGTRGLSHLNKDGILEDPVPTFMVLSNILDNPAYLVRRNDKTKRPAADWGSLTTNNISYELRGGTNVSLEHTNEVLAIDPVNGLILYCDGRVEKNGYYRTDARNN